jgi:autoinducer 2-degrading protein
VAVQSLPSGTEGVNPSGGSARWGVVAGGRWVVVDRHNRRVLIVHVHVHVVPDQVPAFLAATRANATASLEESGVLRFDVITDLADPAHVVLVEAYRDEAGAAAHKETAHYATWRDTVAPMMAVPRTSTKFSAEFPAEDDRWATPAP